MNKGSLYHIPANEKAEIFQQASSITRLPAHAVRMASMEDIAAMKMEGISGGGRKKDFWDVHELNRHLSIPKMIELHAERYPYGHDAAGLRANLTNFSSADDDFDPMCLRGNYWELIKMDLEAAMGK